MRECCQRWFPRKYLKVAWAIVVTFNDIVLTYSTSSHTIIHYDLHGKIYTSCCPVSYNNDCKNYSDKCVHVQMKTTVVNTKSTFQICCFSTQCIHITLGYTWLCTGLVVGLYFYKTSYKPVLL